MTTFKVSVLVTAIVLFCVIVVVIYHSNYGCHNGTADNYRSQLKMNETQGLRVWKHKLVLCDL
jgi:hypothetical protein